MARSGIQRYAALLPTCHSAHLLFCPLPHDQQHRSYHHSLPDAFQLALTESIVFFQLLKPFKLPTHIQATTLLGCGKVHVTSPVLCLLLWIFHSSPLDPLMYGVVWRDMVWRAEQKNAFEWGLPHIPHSADAIAVCQAATNFFVK